MFIELTLKDGSVIDLNVNNIVSVEKKENDVYTSIYLTDKRVVEITKEPKEFKAYIDKLKIIYDGRMMRAALWESDKNSN